MAAGADCRCRPAGWYVATGEQPADGTDVLAFSEPTRAWFAAAFAEPTPAQAGAWEAIAAGRNALVVAPTGSGKTLSAFLWALDRLLTSDRRPRTSCTACRVLYISPLKALARRRRAQPARPAGRHPAHRRAARRAGPRRHASASAPATPRPPTGASSAPTPPDILITTPESLFLMLTCQARETLRGVETVIVDEVHAVAGTKRGAHLALSPRAARRAARRSPAQRIGLSATVRPLEEVARFLGGARAGRDRRAAVRRRSGTSRSSSRSRT